MDNLVHAGIQLSTDLYERIAREALRRNTSMSEIVKRAVEKYLDENPKDWRDKLQSMETKGK